ncbi:MAG: hypothetical protein NVS3B26_27460 [Mycobacteriales bacterium]
MLRTLIVDDDPDVRFLVRMTIEVANHGLSVVGEASTGEEALAAIERCRPEAIVMDYRMPGLTGLETAERILAANPAQHVILLSACLDAGTLTTAASIGIRACLDKSEVNRLPEALRQVHAGT